MRKSEWWKFPRDILLSPGGLITFMVLLVVFYLKGIAPLMQFAGLGAPSQTDAYIVDYATGSTFNLDGTPRASVKKQQPDFGDARFNLVVEFRSLSHLQPTARYSVNGGEAQYLNAQSVGDSGIYKSYRGSIPIGSDIDKRGIHIRVDAPSYHWSPVATVNFGIDAENVKWQRPLDSSGVAYVDQATLALPADTFFATDEVSNDGKSYLREHSLRPPLGFLNHRNLQQPEMTVKECDSVILVDAKLYPFVSPATIKKSSRDDSSRDQMWLLPLPLEWRDGWVTESSTGKEEPTGTQWLRSLAHSTGIYEANIVGKHTLNFPVGIPKLESTLAKPWQWDSKTLIEGYYLYSKGVDTPLWNLRVKLPPALRSKHIRLEAFDQAGKSLGQFPVYPTIHANVVEARTLPMFAQVPLSKVEIYSQDVDQLPMIDGVVQAN